MLMLLLTLNANTLAQNSICVTSPCLFATAPHDRSLQDMRLQSRVAVSSSFRRGSYVNLQRNDPSRLFTGRFPPGNRGRMCPFSPFPRPVLDVFICRQPHSTVYYGNLLRPPPPPPLPFLFSTSSPPIPTLRTVLLSRRCSQFNFATAMQREGREGGEKGLGGRCVGIRDEHRSGGGGGKDDRWEQRHSRWIQDDLLFLQSLKDIIARAPS